LPLGGKFEHISQYHAEKPIAEGKYCSNMESGTSKLKDATTRKEPVLSRKIAGVSITLYNGMGETL